MKDEKDLKNLSRRKFLTGAGTLALGAVGMGLVGCSNTEKPAEDESATTSANEAAETASTNQVEKLPALPWGYEALDPEKIRQQTHSNFWKGMHCMQSTYATIVEALAEKVGYPYTVINTDTMYYGQGGIYGWSTLCGAANGAAAVLNLVVPKEEIGPLVDEIFSYYSVTPFPTETSNKFTSEKCGVPLEQSVSGSPLCHVSVSNWCKASGNAADSPERAERCARVAADIAAFTAEVLNQWAAGKFEPKLALAESVEKCGVCHVTGGQKNTRGKQDCTQCHESHI